MQETNINQQVTETNQQFIQLFSSFSDSQINQVPFMESWTPAQLAEHVLKSESGMLQALQSAGKKADRDPFAKVQRLKDTFLDFSIKMKSPEFIVPEQKEYSKKELEQKLTGIAFQLAETINRVNNEEIISGLPLGEISKGEIIHFIVYHTKRHTHQLQHILQTLNDKTKAMSATKEVIVRNVNDAFKNNDMPAFLSYCTDDILWNMIGSSATQGKDAIMKIMSSMLSDCPDIMIHTVFSEDDKTACAGTFTLVNKEGKRIVHSFCDIYKFRDEKIQTLDSYVVETKT